MKRGSAKSKPEPNGTSPPSRGLRVVDILIVALLFGLLLFHAHEGWITTKDDAFITFRYAEHLAQGKGLVWNVGEGPVEGYTNFLFLLIMAAFSLFRVDLVLAAKIVNLVSTLVVFFMLASIVSRVYRDRYLLYFALVLFVFPYFTAAHIAGGLETMFYSALVTLAVLLLFRQIESHSARRSSALAITFLAMGLTRPEGVLVAALIIVLELLMVKEARTKRDLYPLFFLFVLPGALYMVWRLTYFGYLLPNPFYIKRAEKLLSLVGLIELQEFLLAVNIVVGVVCLPFVEKRARRYLVVLTAVFIPSLAVYMFFRPMMNYAFRYYVPYYALMIPVMGAPLYLVRRGIERLAGSRNLGSTGRVLVSTAALLVALLFLCPFAKKGILDPSSYVRANYEEFLYWKQQGYKLRDCHIHIGKLLRRFPQYSDRYIALGDVGAIPYYSRWKTLDLGGLNDVHLAHYGRALGQEMEVFATRIDLDYVFSKKPAVVIMASSNPVTVDHYASRILAEDPRFGSSYRRVVSYSYSPGIYELVYVRSDDPTLQELVEALIEDALTR